MKVVKEKVAMNCVMCEGGGDEMHDVCEGEGGDEMYEVYKGEGGDEMHDMYEGEGGDEMRDVLGRRW